MQIRQACRNRRATNSGCPAIPGPPEDLTSERPDTGRVKQDPASSEEQK
jgi:hypothetical protein